MTPVVIAVTLSSFNLSSFERGSKVVGVELCEEVGGGEEEDDDVVGEDVVEGHSSPNLVHKQSATVI